MAATRRALVARRAAAKGGEGVRALTWFEPQRCAPERAGVGARFHLGNLLSLCECLHVLGAADHRSALWADGWVGWPRIGAQRRDRGSYNIAQRRALRPHT